MSSFSKTLNSLMALVLLVFVTGCVVGSGPITDLTTDGLEPPAYTLASNDRVRVNVFRHDDLSGEFELDGRGRFAMPLIKEVNASGLTVRELEKLIADAYESGEILVDAQVSVEILTHRPFFIIGEVATPGSYEYDAGMTVLNAIAQAGGFTPRAVKDRFALQRESLSAKEVIVSGRTEVAPGDQIRVFERLF